MTGPPNPPPGRHQVGATGGHPGAPIDWLNDRGYDAVSVGTDGFGKPGRQGLLLSKNLNNPNEPQQVAWLGQWLDWDGTRVAVQDT